MQQKRLLLALAISMGILILWTYISPTPKPPNQNPGATASPSANSTTTPTASTSPQATSTSPAPAPNVSAAAKRIVTIDTPLYEAKFDTLGAEPISWIIKSNKLTNVPIYSVAKPKREQVPLQLISQEGLNRQPRIVPFQLHTGDAA